MAVAMIKWKKVEDVAGRLLLLFEKSDALFLIVMLAINLILKTLFISQPSVWLDEATQVFMSKMTFSGIIGYSLIDPNGPFYTMLLKIWMQLFGLSEGSIRFLSVVFHLGSVVMLFYFAKRFFNKQIAVFALVFFTLSNANIYYAQEARNYSLIVLLVISSFFLFMELLKKTKMSLLITYIVVNTLLLYTHLIPILIFPAQFLVMVFHFHKKPKQSLFIFTGQIIPLLLLSIWFFQNQWFGGRETVWLEPPTLDTVKWHYIFFLNSKAAIWTVAGLLPVAFMGYIFGRKTGKADFPEFLTILLWCFLPAVILFVASHIYNPRYIPRYLLFTTPALYVIVAYFINKIYFSNTLKLAFFILITIFMAASLELNNQKDEDWKGAVADYFQLKNQEAATILCPFHQIRPFLYYYEPQILSYPTNEQEAFLISNDIYPVNSVSEVSMINLQRYKKTILIYSHELLFDPDREILDFLASQFVAKKIVANNNVMIYEFVNTEKPETFEITIDFETFEPSKSIIKTTLARSGEKVTRVDEKNVYSETYKDGIKGLIASRFSVIHASAWVYFSDPSTKAQFVITIENQKNTLHWNGVDIDTNENLNTWSNIEISALIPHNLPEKSILQVYLWNRGETEVLMDDLTIRYE
jgi:mannosyltransferase